MHRYRVAVVRGGPSEEYEVSMQTGLGVLRAINAELFEPIDVVITKNGEWLYAGKIQFPEQILSHVDVVFIALHGAYGEDGRIQRLLDRFHVPYTGSRAYPSGIAINKVLTKDHLRDVGVKMPPHIVVSQDSKKNLYNMAETITDLFGPQYVIKPISSGSSVGTMMVKNPALLPQALDDALAAYDQVLVEKRIIGKEATGGVLNRFRGEDLYALPPIEIIPPETAEFFDKDVKYNGSTLEVCPGNFSREEKREIERLSKAIHEHLDLSQYSRSDFMIAPDGIYFLEVNTLPGLTAESLFPKAMIAVGSSYEELINHLLWDALGR
jgi:D-alanine-D-alanine ligase